MNGTQRLIHMGCKGSEKELWTGKVSQNYLIYIFKLDKVDLQNSEKLTELFKKLIN